MLDLGVLALLRSGVDGFREHLEGKRKIKRAIVDNKARMAESKEGHNQDWEMKQLDNAGYKDDVLFYAFIAMFIWTGFYPEAAREFYKNIEIMPPLFTKVFVALIASVLGLKKFSDYAPAAIKGVREAFNRDIPKV